MATERRTRSPSDPENLLIGLLADEIERDERILEALGAGTVSLKDLENWQRRREQRLAAAVEETGRLVGSMRDDGFERSMRRSGKDRTASPRRAGGPLRTGRRAGAGTGKTPDAPAKRFYLDLSQFKAGCDLSMAGDYDDLLEAGSLHLKRRHHIHGDVDSVRELVASAISEVPFTRLSTEERTHGLRTEEVVSDESANRTRTARGRGGFASA